MGSRTRTASAADAASVHAIYAPIVRDTAISFETEVPTMEEMRRRIVTTLERLPWLVCEGEDGIEGFAYAAPHRARAAYQWTVEVSAYVGERHRRRGVGRELYLALFDDLRRRGFRTATAGIVLPNPASVALHEGMGFSPVGVFHRVGYKLGAWRDVGWWELNLQNLPDPPLPPRASPAM